MADGTNHLTLHDDGQRQKAEEEEETERHLGLIFKAQTKRKESQARIIFKKNYFPLLGLLCLYSILHSSHEPTVK